MIKQCPYCEPGTDAQHEYDCPLHPRFSQGQWQDYRTGWVCPKCGGVNSPWQATCPNCAPPLKVTCNTTSYPVLFSEDMEVGDFKITYDPPKRVGLLFNPNTMEFEVDA